MRTMKGGISKNFFSFFRAIFKQPFWEIWGNFLGFLEQVGEDLSRLRVTSFPLSRKGSAGVGTPLWVI